jgi:hypothetical protein
MGNITNRSPKAEQQQQKKVKERKAELLAKPGLNRHKQDQAINQGGRSDGHTLDRANEKLLP